MTLRSLSFRENQNSMQCESQNSITHLTATAFRDA